MKFKIFLTEDKIKYYFTKEMVTMTNYFTSKNINNYEHNKLINIKQQHNSKQETTLTQ